VILQDHLNPVIQAGFKPSRPMVSPPLLDVCVDGLVAALTVEARSQRVAKYRSAAISEGSLDFRNCGRRLKPVAFKRPFGDAGTNRNRWYQTVPKRAETSLLGC
jgi:hypothetical protein